MRRAWVVTGIISGIVSLIATQLFQFDAVDSQIAAEAAGLLKVAIEVADESKETLVAVNKLPGPPCTPGDLGSLRYIAARSKYIMDVGRYRDGKVECTGLWGVPAVPMPLPAPDRIIAGNFLMWQQKQVAFDDRLKSDMAVSGNAINYTRQSAFKRYDDISDGTRAIVLTSDGEHVFRGFGNNARALVAAFQTPNGLFRMRGRHITKCDWQVPICVVFQTGVSANVFERSPLVAWAVLLLGALAGAGGERTLESYIRSSRDLDRQLLRALKRSRFRVAYQPIVALKDGRIIGVEALARWNDEAGQPVSPEVFVARIEKMNLLPKLTNAIVVRALSELHDYLTAPSSFYVSINVGVTDLLLPDFKTSLLKETLIRKIDPSRIALEITERDSVDMEALIAAVVEFRAVGYKVFIDDFGTGYSGLAYLANMPVDVVKVDRMFTSAVGTDSLRAKMFNSICSMINEVSGSILVEGVETAEQAERLRRLLPNGSAQGWFFGKPTEGVAVLDAHFNKTFASKAL